MLYRVISNICLPDDTRFPKGTVSPLREATSKGKQALLAKGTLTKVQAPPLKALPGWERLAEVFAEYGIEDVTQLACADLEDLAAKIGISTSKLKACVEEAMRYIS